jgi:hypothetical protein
LRRAKFDDAITVSHQSDCAAVHTAAEPYLNLFALLFLPV